MRTALITSWRGSLPGAGHTRAIPCDVRTFSPQLSTFEYNKEGRVWFEGIILVCHYCLYFCHVSDYCEYHRGETHLSVWISGSGRYYRVPAELPVRGRADRSLRIWSSQVRHLARFRV